MYLAVATVNYYNEYLIVNYTSKRSGNEDAQSIFLSLLIELCVNQKI